MNDNNDFDQIIQRMSQSDFPETTKPFMLRAMMGLMGAIFLISFFGGAVIMLINMIINDAYPNLGDFEPGIGYWNAVRLFFFSWVLFAMVKGLIGMQKKS